MTPAKKVFISYSRTDSERVTPLIEGIRRMRYEIWLDQELSGGQAWWNTILGHIRECDVILLAVSLKAMESEACRQEFEYARALSKPILPVIVEPVAHQVLWSELAVIQLVDYTGPPGKAAFDLISALSQLPAAGELPDPLPAQPPVPMSYLTEMAHIVQARTLSLDEQLAVLGKLKARLRRPGEHEGVIQLIHKLRDRSDLFHATAMEINELLADRSLAPAEAVPPMQHTPVPAPPVIHTPPPSPPPAPPVRPPTQSVPSPAPRVFTGPPPSIPPPQIAHQAPPVGYPAPPAPWVATTPRKADVPTWLIVVLLIGAGLAALGAAGCVALIFSGTSAPGGSQTLLYQSANDVTRLAISAVMFAIATSASVATVIGLMGGDRWGPVVGWVAVTALALTLVGIPFAAAVAWGLMRTPKPQVVAAGTRPGAGLRLGSAALGSVLLIAITGSTAAYGWTHRQSTVGPVAKPTPSPSACAIAQPDTPITAAAAGGLCGFRLGAAVTQMDCRTVTAPPGALSASSWDYNKSAAGGGGTFAMDSAGCHFVVPAYGVASDLLSSGNIPYTDSVLVADVVPLTGAVAWRIVFGCDNTGCVRAELYLPANTLDIFDDSTDLISQHVTVRTGTNRLIFMVQQQQLKAWFNGAALATQNAARLHDAGTYGVSLYSLDKTGPVKIDVLQFALFKLG